MFKLRDIAPGKSFPPLGVFTRTGRSFQNFVTRQLIVRFPIWALYCTRYDMSNDEFVTCWWARMVNITFERCTDGVHMLAVRVIWGDQRVFNHAKAYEPKPLAE